MKAKAGPGRGHRVTKVQLDRFLVELAEGHTVKTAATLARLGHTAVYARRTSDPVFAAAWSDALEQGTQVLEEEARRRALVGVSEPVFYKGEVCGEVQKYSDTLLIFMLKARRPEVYRERVDVSGNVKHEHITIDAIDAEIARLSAELAERPVPAKENA